MEKRVFLSVGRTSTKEQEEFVKAVEDFLRNHDLIPQTVGRTYFSSTQPLKAVDDLLRQCCGTVIIALERVFIKSGTEKRGSPDEKVLENTTLPTVWNQIEAAMAYALGHPLLVIVENGLRSEGLLERGYDWFVNWVNVGPEALAAREFQGVFMDWKRRVDLFYTQLQNNPSEHRLSVPLPKQTPLSISQPITETGSEKIKILFLTANPSDTSRLRLDQESRAIDQALRRAQFRDRFEFNQYQALRLADLQECLLRFAPHIIHFSGHGTGDGRLILEDASGKGRPVSERALEGLFQNLRDNIRCVVLNACYSDNQARAIAKNVDCVIGMSEAIGDESAISFSSAFYQALAYGRDVGTAFNLGCIQIDLENLQGDDIPKLTANRIAPQDVRFAS